MLKAVGAQIRTHRKRHGLTIEQLAKASKVESAYLGEVERGRGNVTVLVLWKLCRTLDTSLSEMLPDLKPQ
jgi:XRE family aerobic/anaerobic benzoate catabolism transcriptional regulator